MNEIAKEKALKYLLYKARSEKEMRRFLEKQKCTPEEIEEIIDYLYHFQYLDDANYAGMFVRDKIRFAPCGSIKLRYELSEKGIDEAFIEEALAENLPFSEEVLLAEQILERKNRTADDPQKIRRYLYGKGFPVDVIESVSYLQ